VLAAFQISSEKLLLPDFPIGASPNLISNLKFEISNALPLNAPNCPDARSALPNRAAAAFGRRYAGHQLPED
jgi:hypothetical protein